MTSTSPTISFEHVSKTYVSDFRRKKSKALADMNFGVRKGEVFGIVGPNGAGKSTTLKILLGFIRYDTGRVILSGFSPVDPKAHHSLGYLPENPCLYEHLSITDHLVFAARIHKAVSKAAKLRIEELLEMVDLTQYAKTPIRSFSKGMTQRAALAYALFHQPEILILDEPMSGLDPLGRRLVVEIIKDYNKTGRTVLFCSHVLTDVERICHKIGVMHKGRLAAVVTPRELAYDHAASGGASDVSPLESYFLKTVQGHA